MTDLEKPRLARLTAIITQLQSKKLVTATEIADKHGVSIRTVYRDIRTLENSGIPILTEEGKGYSLMEGYSLPPIMFSEEEAQALITAEQIIALNNDESLKKQYNEAIEKIKSVLRHSQKEKVELLSDRIFVRGNPLQQRSSKFLMTLQTALTNYQLLHMEYHSLNDVTTKRDVEPFAIYSTRDNWIVVAYCRLRQDFRAFRVDHIEKLIVLNEHFEPHNMSLQEYFEKCAKEWQTPDTPLTQPPSTFVSNQKQTTMQTVEVKPFQVIGIPMKTTNHENQMQKDLQNHWHRFMADNVAEKIPNKTSPDIYAVYTDYEGDETNPYVVVIGCAVSSMEELPEGMQAVNIEGGSYGKFMAKGDVTGPAMFEGWTQVWKSGINRAYKTDFEVYDERCADPKNAEADILISMN